jgi:hypothetical protein
MAGRQAKILTVADVEDLLVFASCTRNPVRNRVIVLLSAKAGLRAGEIADLDHGPRRQRPHQHRHRAARHGRKEGQRPLDPHSFRPWPGAVRLAPQVRISSPTGGRPIDP